MRYVKGYIDPKTDKVLWGYRKDKPLWMTKETYAVQNEKVGVKARAKYWENIEESRRKNREARAKHSIQRNIDFKEWASKNKVKIRGNRLLRAYGLTNELYHDMVVEQNNLCAICGSKQHGGEERFLCVDHCHDTGAVRGLLCVKCNTGLGQFLDNQDFLRNAIFYLDYHQSMSITEEQ